MSAARPLQESPPWHTLPDAGGGRRLVDNRPMFRDEYETCGWHIVNRYEVEHPHRVGCLQRSRTVEVWSMGTLAQIEAWSRKRRERFASVSQRDAEDEHFRTLYPETRPEDAA
jgi:hypothetical protein